MWTKVNVGYNAEEETINFGTRACAVNDVAVYETNTLAAILAGDKKPTSLPQVQAQFFEQVGLCVAIDTSLTVFSEDCSSVKCIISIQSNIEVFTVTPCGAFILVGACGQIMCFHIPSKGTEVFKRTINSNTDVKHFITLDCCKESDQTSVIMVSKTGQIIKLSQIDFVQLEEACSYKNSSSVEVIIQKIQCEEVYRVKPMQSQVCTGLSLLKEKDSALLGSAQNLCMLHVNDFDEALSTLLDDLKIVKIGGVLNDSVLFALCDNGSILQVCLYTMIPYFLWSDFPVKDFIVLEGHTAYECNLLALVDEPATGQHAVLISWPGFTVQYRLPVAGASYLINQKGSEEILFLEGFGYEQIDTVRVKAIIESQPDLRLDRILKRCKFEEAEKFAKAFSLDLEIVYKAHVQRLSQDLGSLRFTLDVQKTIFNKILELIEKIKMISLILSCEELAITAPDEGVANLPAFFLKISEEFLIFGRQVVADIPMTSSRRFQDHHFVAELCVSVIPPDFAMLHTMLMYGMERFSKVTDKSGANLSELLARVSTIARRLDTCMLIHGAGTTVEHWIEFPKHDLVISCLNHIKRGKVKESIMIWSRHFSDMKAMLSMDSARLLLYSIPNATKLDELLLSLQHFVPPILAFFPNILMDVVQWTIQRARHLEILDGKTWPSSGLALAKCVLRLVHTPFTEKSVLLQSQRVALRNENMSHQSPLNQLFQLINTLNDISTLKEKYGLSIHYNEFAQEDDGSFVAVLLERLPLEKINLFMVEFYHRLMMDRGLDPDTEILHFIQDIVMNCEDWWFWDEAPWEARVSALIPHVNNIELKLDAILHVLTSAPVPWTSTVSQLAEQGVRLPHFKASDVRNECNNVPKRLIMKKYGVLIDRKREMQLVRLILKKNQKSMLEDVKELAKCVKGDVTDIYLIVIIHLIEKGAENMVLEVLKTVNQECRSECLSRLIYHIHRLVAHNAWGKLPAYFKFMPAVENPKEKRFLSELKNIYCLKMEFGITTTSGKMCKPIEKQNILESFADKTANELASGTLVESIAVQRMCRLAYLLHMTSEEGIIALSSFCVNHNLQLALAVSSKIEDLEGKPAQVYKKVSMLVGLLSAFYKPAESSGVLIENFTTVTNKIARSVLANSSNCDLNNICKWVSLLNVSSFNTKSILKTMYGDPAPTAATAILAHSSFQNIVRSYIKSCRDAGRPVHESMNAVLINKCGTTIENREMVVTWQKLKEEQQDLSCIRLVCEYCWSQKIVNSSLQVNTPVETFLTQCIKDLLRKLFRLRNFDIELAMSLLHFFGKNEAMGFLVEEAQSVGYNYQRLGAISHLALTFCYVSKIDKYSKSFKKYHVSCKWAKKLNEVGLQYKDAFKETETEHRQLILKLITLPSTTVPLLKEFCIDYVFEQQECLMIYLEYLLLNWEPDIHISLEPSTGNRVMRVNNSPSELLQQCKAILHELGTVSVKSELGSMSWSESIQNELCNLWNKVNYYYYEVYFVLTDLYQRVLARQVVLNQINNSKAVLGFLQTYTRISSPSETEQDQWFQLFPNTNNLPPISNFRLPLNPFFLKEPPWAFIKPELSLKTYKIWYDIIPTLGLDRDMLCTLSIQRLTIDQLGGGNRDKSSWRLHACNNSVLQDIQECVRNIQNQEVASASLYYVVNHMPPGADQMAAAKLCYLQAEQWITQDNTDKAKIGFAKVQKKYLTVCTSHILHSSGLGKPEYLQLVLQPQELICALYDDPSILKRNTGTLSHCPEINGVVMEIGQLHRVNVVGIQQELLSEWLYPPDSPPLDMSCDDITQNMAAIHSNYTALTDNYSIIRACYVLESMDMETAAKYLVSYASLRDEQECRPTAVRLRALQCLCFIATPDIIIKTTGTTVDNIKGSMQNLMFISELEKLGLVWSPKGFESCDKEDVIRILLTKASPHAMQLAAAMGCVFKLTNTLYWDQILQLMTSYGMVEELLIVLPQLTYLCHLLNNAVLSGAWNCALVTPLLKAECPLNKESSCQVSRSLEMLYCCPVPRQVNLVLMLEHCQRLRSDELVARLQPFLSLTHPSPLTLIKQESLN